MIPRENLDAPDTVPVDIEPFRAGKVFAYRGDHYRVRRFALIDDVGEPLTVELELAQTEAGGDAVDSDPLWSAQTFTAGSCAYGLIAMDWGDFGPGRKTLRVRLMRTWWADR